MSYTFFFVSRTCVHACANAKTCILKMLKLHYILFCVVIHDTRHYRTWPSLHWAKSYNVLHLSIAWQVRFNVFIVSIYRQLKHVIRFGNVQVYNYMYEGSKIINNSKEEIIARGLVVHSSSVVALLSHDTLSSKKFNVIYDLLFLQHFTMQHNSVSIPTWFDIRVFKTVSLYTAWCKHVINDYINVWQPYFDFN